MNKTESLITKKSKFCLAAVLFLSLSLSSSVISQEGLDGEDNVKMIIGETKVISVTAPTKVVIADPKVADVIDVTNSAITVGAKEAGFTTLVYWDAFGEQSVKIKVFNEDIQDIKERIDDMLNHIGCSEVYTKGVENEGKVVLMGRVKTAQDRERIMTALGPLKDKTIDLIRVKEEETIIQIDVQVLEIDKDATTALGFTWPSQVNITEVGSPGIPGIGSVAVTTGTTPSTSTTVSNTGSSWGKLFRVANVSRGAFNLTIDALMREGKARILSRPQLSCQSGKEADLLVGGEVPIFTTTVAASTGATGTNIDYKEFGIKLKIKPTVTEKDRIKVACNVEVSDIGQPETIGSTTTVTAKAYPISKRTASTELFLNDGQTLSIGGLIKQKTEEDLQKVPWLADVPVLGAFFRSKSIKSGGGSGSRGDTELFISITPKIVSRGEPLDYRTESQKEQANAMVKDIISTPEPLTTYAALIKKRILDSVKYPAQAKDAGFEGTVKLGMHMSFQGELLDAVVKDSSGYEILDSSALNAAKSVSSYPPFPASINSKDIWIEIPVDYRLN